MKILAIDTSNHPLAVALVEDAELLAETTLNLTKNHSIYLMPVVERLMQVAKWSPADLDRVVVAQGPGSYTGVRIAVTTAKTLASTLDIDLVGVSSLAVLAQMPAKLTKLPVVAIFNARRNTTFAGGYQWVNGQLQSVIAEQHIDFAELVTEIDRLGQEVLLVGELTPEFKSQVTDHPLIRLGDVESAFPSTYQLALMGANQDPVTDIDGFVPNYLRVTEAEMNWQKLHLGESKKSYVREV